MQFQQSNSDISESGSVQTGESQRQKDEIGGVQRKGLLMLRTQLPGRATLQLPFRNKDDDYVPVVDVMSVLTEIGFSSRVLLQSMHVNLVQESVYLELRVADTKLHKEVASFSTFTLYRQAVHSINDDRVGYQCFYGLASTDAPDKAVYWIGVGMRLRSGKTRHFPADAALDGDLGAQWNAMLNQDPGN